MAPSRSGLSREARKIAVGPSAPPMMPMAAASWSEKSMAGTSSLMASDPSRVKKMPNCAAAPSISVLGLAMSAPKSVRAPTPRKMSSGKMPVDTPTE